ncbi:hypothetical protein PFISCL1PPCAC_12631, partial [Pristionchus fissidentatus]
MHALLRYTHIFSYFRYTHLTINDGTDGATAVRQAFTDKYNRTIKDGWLIVDYYVPSGSLDPIAFSFFVSGVIKMLISLVSSSSLAILTYREIIKARDKSFGFRTMQLKFLRTVIAQSTVPILFVYFPYFAVIFWPLMGWESTTLGSSFPMFTSLFPPFDAIVIILMIKDYR